jgi:hypothetical protein
MDLQNPHSLMFLENCSPSHKLWPCTYDSALREPTAQLPSNAHGIIILLLLFLQKQSLDACNLAELAWVEEHELAWRAQKKAPKGRARRDWAAIDSKFAKHFGRTSGAAAISKQAEKWSKAHPDEDTYKKWTSPEEAWLAERVPAGWTDLRNSHLAGVARAFAATFKYERSISAIRRKVEWTRDRACKESWAACLAGSVGP